MAWNRAGLCRNSLISWSSSTASSQPATSAKVTLGSSFDTWRAFALPNCITRLPPPCIELRTNRNRPNSTIIGRRLNSSDVQMESSC